MKIARWEFKLWFDGKRWSASGTDGVRSISAEGETPTTAMINAESAAYRVEQRNPEALEEAR